MVTSLVSGGSLPVPFYNPGGVRSPRLQSGAVPTREGRCWRPRPFLLFFSPSPIPGGAPERGEGEQGRRGRSRSRGAHLPLSAPAPTSPARGRLGDPAGSRSGLRNKPTFGKLPPVSPVARPPPPPAPWLGARRGRSHRRSGAPGPQGRAGERARRWFPAAGLLSGARGSGAR